MMSPVDGQAWRPSSRNVIHPGSSRSVTLAACFGGITVASKMCIRRFTASVTQISLSSGVKPTPWLGQPWRLGTPTPYSIVCVTKARVARIPLTEWAAFLQARTEAKQVFEYCVMRAMSEIMAHTITLHLLDAPGRVHRFMRKHPELVDRIPQKELASYLNLSAETLSRLRHSGKI